MNVVLLLSREEIFCSSQMPKVRTPFGQSEARICMTSQTLINFLHVVMTVLIRYVEDVAPQNISKAKEKSSIYIGM